MGGMIPDRPGSRLPVKSRAGEAPAVFLNAAAGAFFWCRPPIRHLRRRLVGESGKVLEGEWIKWTPTYLYLTMIELLVPLRG